MAYPALCPHAPLEPPLPTRLVALSLTFARCGHPLPLLPPLQEYVWRALYSAVGLTEDELDAYFSGSAFFAWQRMGNIQGASPGPLGGVGVAFTGCCVGVCGGILL